MNRLGDRSRSAGQAEQERPTDAGVSDVIGFVIVFGVVVVSITLMYTFGLGALKDIQHGEAMENSERAFDVLADNMADMHTQRAPGRSTELQFGRGELSTTGRVAVVVNVSDGPQRDYQVTPISFRSQETGFHYATGAVVRTERDAAAIVTEPPFTFGEKRVVLSVVDTSAQGETTSLGGGTIRVTGQRQGQTELALAATDVSTVNVSITSPRHEAWARYFRQEGCETVTTDRASETVTCEFATDAVYVRRTPIGVELTP